MNRRRFLAGLGALLAAPAIVRADNLMRVRGVIVPMGGRFMPGDRFYWNIYSDLDFSITQHSLTIRDWNTAHFLDEGGHPGELPA